MLNFSDTGRTQYMNKGFSVTAMELSQAEPHLLITSESKRIRVWDLRVPMNIARNSNGVLAIDTYEQASNLKSYTCAAQEKKDFIAGAQKMTY